MGRGSSDEPKSKTLQFIEIVTNGSIQARLISMGADPAFVEDAVQEAFIEVAPRLSTIKSPWSYAVKVAWRKYRDIIKKNRPNQTIPYHDLDSTMAEPGSGPFEKAYAQEQVELFADSLRQLSNQKHRAVLQLVRDGRSIKEIAETLGETEENVRVMKLRGIREAMRMLRSPALPFK